MRDTIQLILPLIPAAGFLGMVAWSGVGWVMRRRRERAEVKAEESGFAPYYVPPASKDDKGGWFTAEGRRLGERRRKR